MAEDERLAWLNVARHTLAGIPADLMQRGAQYARQHADHPMKVVPKIIECVGADWERRKRELARARHEAAEEAQLRLPRRVPQPIPRSETQAILAEVAASMLDDENGA